MSKKITHQKAMGKVIRKQTLRKNKPKSNRKKKGPRKKDWMEEDWDEIEEFADERIAPRGETERRRTAEKNLFHQPKNEPSSVQSQGEVSLDEDVVEGVVVGVYTQNCDVEIGEEIWRCAWRGSLRDRMDGFSNPLAVGDKVRVSQVGAGEGVVEAVLPRQNVLARQHIKNPALRQAVAANIDRVLIVQAWREPKFWSELVDRYLIAAGVNGLQAVLCVNKIDLVKDKAEFNAALKPYRDLGLQVMETSALKGEGIKEFRKLLANSTTVLAGLSGVGKSSLISAAQPELDLDALTIGMRGKNRNQGRHTTAMSTLYRLDNDGLVIDTPGIREFGLAGLSRRELAGYYPEMAALAGDCQYGNCSHIQEPGCAVRGQVSQVRYESYVKIYEGMGGD